MWNGMQSPDISIIYSEDSSNWHNYLLECFSQIPESPENLLSINSVPIEDLELPQTARNNDALASSSVQLIILSPAFLNYISNNRNIFYIGQLLAPDKIIAMLCGVETSDITPVHKAALVSYDSWVNKLYVIDQSKDFVIRILHKTAEILSSVYEEPHVQIYKPQFKITPRRIREGNEKIYVILKRPITNKESINVIIECNGEGDTRCHRVSFKISNPYTLQFKLSSEYTAMSSLLYVHVYHDGAKLGTQTICCLSKMGELAHLLHKTSSSPVEFMCQALGLNPNNSHEQIDYHLSNSLKKFELSQGKLSILDFSLEDANVDLTSNEEIPTFLHFAAQYGFQKLCSSLLDCIGATVACQIRNVHGQTPTEIAQTAGHVYTAKLLEDFQTECELADIYTQRRNENCPTYEKNEDSYSNKEKSYSSESDSLEDIIPPAPQITSSGSSDENAEYIEMTGSKVDLIDGEMLEPHKKMLLGMKHSCPIGEISDEVYYEAMKGLVEVPNGNESSERTHLSKSQCELIEILNEYKDNNYSLNEVELLYRNWQQKQNSASLKEKEEKLNVMRKNYESVQLKSQAKNKAPSKVKQFISIFMSKGNNKTEDQASNGPVISAPIISKPDQTNNERAELSSNVMWRLSTTSSSSSTSVDRISCVSHDSGNHSDGIADDHSVRQHNLKESSRLHEKKKAKQKLSRTVFLDPHLTERLSSSVHPRLPIRNRSNGNLNRYENITSSAPRYARSQTGFNSGKNDSFGYVLPDVKPTYSIHDFAEKPPIPSRSSRAVSKPLPEGKSVFYDNLVDATSKKMKDELPLNDYIEMNPDSQSPYQRRKTCTGQETDYNEYKRKCHIGDTELLTNLNYVSMSLSQNDIPSASADTDVPSELPPLPPPREKYPSSQKPALPPKCPSIPSHSRLPPKPLPVWKV